VNKNNETEQHLLMEIEELRTRLEVARQRLQEANERMRTEMAERKRVEEAFIRAQRHAESVVETIREPLLVLTADLKVISANQSFYRTFKVTPEETEGRFIYSVGNHQWDIPLLRKLLEEIVPQNSQFTGFEVDHEFPVIGPKSMLLNARRIYQQGKGTEMILLAIEDITEQNQARKGLQVSETRYRRLFEAAQDGILILDADTGQILDVNPFLIKMLGFSHEDFLGRKLWEIGAFKDIEASQAAFSALQTRGYVRYEDLPLQTREGRFIAVEFVSNSYLVDHQKVIQCNIRDITERKKADEKLRGREEHYRSYIELTGQLAWTTNAGGQIVEDIPLWRKFTGQSEEETKGAGWAKALHPDDVQHTLDVWNNAVTAKSAYEVEYRIRRYDGIYRHFLARGVPFFQDDGNMQGWVGTCIDITERKQAEEVLRMAHEALESRVQERTSKLAQANKELREEIARREKVEEQLLQTQKLESVGTLTGGIAHDFNNMLGAIVINSEMALLGLPVGSGIHNNLDLILKSAIRGRDLVRQMLLFSRKSEKKQEVISLIPLIKETFKLLRSSLPATIQMKLLQETEFDTVYGDPSQIQQVVMNLCTNAAHAMRGKTGVIDISLQATTLGLMDLPEADMEPGEYVILSVKDTGSGMDAEVKKRIFEPFFTTKSVGEGTGLGLSVVYGIVKGHRGNITVYSEPGKGSIFRVYLPKVDTASVEEAEVLKPLPRGKERILFVDDEEIIVNSVRNMLEHLGYKVTTLMDSEEALKLFSANPWQFDLVMSDQTMPFMTGEDLGREMMRIRPDIPIVLCTGYSDIISSEKAKAFGFRGYIMKPFSVREGAELMRQVLDQKRSK